MKSCKFLTAGESAALDHAVDRLTGWGYCFADRPGADVTHLLLPVPAFDQTGKLKGGRELEALLRVLPHNVCVLGGGLSHPGLKNYHTVDFLQDPFYLSENAYITAHCAVRLCMNRLPCTLRGCPVLVIGWGRIGKCLSAMLKKMDAKATAAARKDADRASLQSLGYESIPVEGLDDAPYCVIFNTAPFMVLPRCESSALKIDLASQPGIGGEDVLWARGLPGTDAPESAGELMARTTVRLLQEDVL